MSDLHVLVGVAGEHYALPVGDVLEVAEREKPLGAIVQFGEEGPQTGDVEVDVRTSGWRSHCSIISSNWSTTLSQKSAASCLRS